MTKPEIYREQTVVIKEEGERYLCECIEVPHRPRTYLKTESTRESILKAYCANLEIYGVRGVIQ